MIFQNIFEPVRKVDAPEELRPETDLPPLEMPEPNFFDGMGDTWKAIPNAVLDTASSAITGLRQIPLENFTTQPEVREWVRRQREEVMPENARRIREIAKQEYELNPQTSGTAAQIVYGLGEMIPKAVLYGSVAGPAGGALLFGADVGVNRTQTLLDEGVDEQTAINAGMLTFAANAIGLKLPAAFATGSRLTSAAIGAGANVGLNVAEVQGVHWILENQNYDELAKNYELNFADNAVAAGLGAAFGAAFWRPTTRVRFEQERKALSERFATELERTGKFTPQQVTAQANINSAVVTSAASRWGLTPEQVSSVAPRVRIAETTNQTDLNQQGEFNQTAWHGSQNQFDRFSTEYIGEGTGRATHGWGLYFTSDKKVAEGYRDMTGPDGKVYKAEVPDNNVLLDANESYAEQPSEVREALARLYKDEYDTEPPPDHWTGREIYQDIILREEGYSDPESIPDDYMLDMEFDELAGNSRLASEKLNSIGVKGVKFLGDDDDTGFVVFDDQAIKILDFYQRQGGEAMGSYSPAENRITLTPNANISTFSHEIGHWYLHNLMLASQFEEAAGNVKQDVDVLLKAFGINSVDDWNALGVNGQRKYHERFASWVEQYLSEGKSPSPSLVSFFKRFGEWLKDVYEHFSDAVGGRYQAEFGEELPPLSAEVRKVLDRMYTDEFGSKTVRPDKTQVAAARAVQAEETNREKRNRILATDSEDDYSKAVAAQRKAASDLNSGTPIDVSQQMRGASLNEQVLGAEQKKFAREVMAGDGRTAVVLQNRDRSNAVSVGQMNSIASDPQYGLLSFSRNTASGAPIVSYGTLPDDSYLGVRDYVIDSGEQVPVQYAVVEADTVQTSNRFDGSQNPDYGDASLMNVVAGNGRLTGLTEAYRRGTAQQYREALMSDTQHGVDPAVIASMQHPVLVRYMPQEKVSTGFVSRSNSDQVMARSNVEIAAEDAPRIRENASLYRFDEEGMPTAETVRQFLIDIGEPNALGRLINSSGAPTPEAIRRIQTAVFHEAYQNDVLTELFSSTTDANIKRILTAMAAFAPRIIEMRNAGIDLARGIVEAANAVRMAREEGHSLQDLLGQLSFLDDPTTNPFIELLARNANSAAAIGRVLEPLADWTVNAMRAADGGLFGEENVVRTDVADVLGQMRRIENEQRVAAGQEPLPELDVAAIRASIQNLQSQLDEIAAQAPDTAQAEPNPQQVQAAVRDGVANDPDAIRMQELASQQPEQTFLFEDEDGQTVELRFDEVESEMQRIENEGKTEASGIAQAAICIMRNDGAQ